MMQRSFLLRAAAVALSLSPLAACGDSDGPDKNHGADAGADSSVDTHDDVDSGNGDGDATSPDSGNSDPDASNGGDGDGDGDAPEPVRTATVRFGEQSWTVTPRVSRGLGAPPEETYHRAIAELPTRTLELSCAPDALQTGGGRAIRVSANTVQTYGGSQLCENGGGGLVDARTGVYSTAGQNCNGRTKCSLDAFSAYYGRLWGCSGSGPTSIQIDYACQAMPGVAPMMRLDYDGEVKVSVTALDGAGSATCTQRGASITLTEGYSLTDAACVIDITTRTPSSLAGTISLSVFKESDEQVYPLSIEFHHEQNTLRPSLLQSGEQHACSTNAVSHSTRVTDNHTTDIISALPPYTCEPAGQYELPTAATVAIRRPAPDDTDAPQASFTCGPEGRISVRIGNRSTDHGACSAVTFGEDAHAVRAMIHSILLCDDKGEDCVSHNETLLLTYDYSNLTK